MGRLMRATIRRMALAVAVGAFLVGTVAAPVRAADPTFGRPTIEAAFGDGITVEQPITLDARPFRVELLLTTGGASGPVVTEVPAPSAGSSRLSWTLDTELGHLTPNTPVSARWRVTMADGEAPVLGPTVETIYRDDRFDWQTVEGDVVRVHWYEGDRAFGERALRIGEDAVRETAALLGVTEDAPVDFFIYPDQAAFYDALGPGTRENVGGQANADIRTMFALIAPSAIDDPWVSVVVPHELVHLVFDTAVDNPYHFPPRWLNEGLAVYLSEGYSSSDRMAVELAAEEGMLIPLDALTGQFPTTMDGFFLAYAESVSAVDYFIRTHGQEALVQLISSYAEGRTDDEAFEAAIGQDTATFGAAWLADLGAEVPERVGPQPAPAGPVPAAWADDPGTGQPAPTGGPAATPRVAPAPGAPSTSGDPAALAPVLALIVVGVAAGALILLRWRGQRRRLGGAGTS
jgi:hypothetical protein